LGGGTTPLPIIYYVPFHGDYMQMPFFLRSPIIGTFVVPKLWMFIFLSNQIFFENERGISYSL
jgi:hypothetical protein